MTRSKQMGEVPVASVAPQGSGEGGVRVLTVDAGSPAERAGLCAEIRLLSINGHEINDVIDYWFHSTDERLKVVWIPPGGGAAQSATIRKAYHERLGCEIEPFEIRRCSNACVFCFVHQNPVGMRRELYIKDEDYRLSFLYGNYITGTNLSPADIDRIIALKLSPLYFSVHATDQALREELLVKRGIEPIVPLMRHLIDHGITTHAQIVLCPGLNDGKVFEQTVADLATLYPGLESIAVVPLGLTRHRERLPDLQHVTPEYAAHFLSHCEKVQRATEKRIGYPLVFPSDEFYLIAGTNPPSYDAYPEIPQLANGVGVMYRFYEGWDSLLRSLPRTLESPLRVAAITTPLGQLVLERLVQDLNHHIASIELRTLCATNSLFGEGITVTGLLPGQDFLNQMLGNPDFDRYLIPENSLRPWDKRFMDDMTLEELRGRIPVPIATGGDTAASFVDALLAPAAAPA